MNKRKRAIELGALTSTFLVIQPAVIAVEPVPSTIFFDGDFEEVRAGTAPDCYPDSDGYVRQIKAAGAWNFNMTGGTTWELDSDTWSVVSESDGPMEGTGNSLRAMANGLASDAAVQLLNSWRTKVQPEVGQIVRVSFDIFMPDTGKQGGSILISGNRSGYGNSISSDRAVQISFDDTGAIVARVGAGNLVELMSDVPYGVWQSMRIDLDVNAHTYDVYWALRGDQPVLIGADLPFRAADLGFLDHTILALWGSYGTDVSSYWDNFEVTILETNESVE